MKYLLKSTEVRIYFRGTYDVYSMRKGYISIESTTEYLVNVSRRAMHNTKEDKKYDKYIEFGEYNLAFRSGNVI